jgi:outer membrane receptor protein involved in Fe transport
LFSFGGPIKIPHVWKNGPTFNVQYQLTRNGNDSTLSALLPTAAERTGNLSAIPTPIINPATDMPFMNNMVPVSSQAAALLNLYPMPNLTGNARYNYQIPAITSLRQDAMTSRFSKTVNRKDTFSGGYSFQSTRTSTPNVFGFLDSSTRLGQSVNVAWFHRFNQRVSSNATFQYSRTATTAVPYWDNRTNVSGNAGITGNDTDPTDWGPPTLSFSSGIQGLTDGLPAHNRNQTTSLGDQIQWRYRLHIFTFGGDFRRQEFNYLAQTNPRGVFSFTGAASGSDLADFLLGIPDASSIAFGNADKYFRQSAYDAYFDDDWKVNPRLSLKLGLRWEYGAPITELQDRLVNLDISPTFTAEAPVLASHPVGTITGQTYPNSLVRPDKRGIEPNVGLAWRPISGSSIVVRAGYSLRFDTSVYQSIALQMAQQSPLSTSANVQNSAVSAHACGWFQYLSINHSG